MKSITECLKCNGGISEAYASGIERNSTIKNLRSVIKDKILKFHYVNLFRLFRENGSEEAIKKEFKNVFEGLAVANEMINELYKTNSNVYWVRRVKELIARSLKDFGEAKRIWENPDEYDASSQLIPNMLNKVHAQLEDMNRTFSREIS